MELIPLLAMAPILIAAAYFDLRYMRIPNALVFVGIAIFLLTCWFVSWPELGFRLLASALVFGVGLLIFVMRWAGGGDIKLLALLTATIPTQSWPLFVVAFALASVLGAMFIVTLRRAPWLQDTDWVTITRGGTFPLGISIALSGLIHPFLLNFLASRIPF